MKKALNENCAHLKKELLSYIDHRIKTLIKTMKQNIQKREPEKRELFKNKMVGRIEELRTLGVWMRGQK